MDPVVVGLVWYAVLLFSLTFHEAAHAYVAARGGDLTAYRGGQVSLDPRPHVRREPFGTVVVPILSYALAGWMLGWASTPYDPRWAHRYPRRAAWMSLAGPAANLVLVLVAALVIRVGVGLEIFHAPDSVNFSRVTVATSAGVWSAVATLVSVLFTLNLLLCVFNMIPVPPLDGSGVVGLFLNDDAARRYRELVSRPAVSLIGLLVAWNLVGPVFSHIHLVAINLLYPGVVYG